MAVKIVANSALELDVGDEQAPLVFTVTPELNQQYLFAVEDFHPRYWSSGEWGEPIVHPSILMNMSNRTRSPSFKLPPGWSSIHARDETEFHSPARVGDTLTVSWKVVERYERRERPYQALEVRITRPDGTLALRRIAHSTVSRPDKAVTGKSS